MPYKSIHIPPTVTTVVEYIFTCFSVFKYSFLKIKSFFLRLYWVFLMLNIQVTNCNTEKVEGMNIFVAEDVGIFPRLFTDLKVSLLCPSLLCFLPLIPLGETPQWLLRDTVKPPSEKAKEAAKTLASAASAPQKPQQYV